MSNLKDIVIQEYNREKAESGNFDRYPVRFVFSYLSKETYQNVFDAFASLNDVQVIFLADYLEKKDYWTTWNYLFSKIREFIVDCEKDVFIIGLSEYLRFVPETRVESIIVQLAGLENKPLCREKSHRCFFLIDSLFYLVSHFLENDIHRSTFYQPVIDLRGNEVLNDQNRVCAFIDDEKEGSENKRVYDYLKLPSYVYRSESNEIWFHSKPLFKLAKNSAFLNDSNLPYHWLGDTVGYIKRSVKDLPDDIENSPEEYKKFLEEKVTQTGNVTFSDLLKIILDYKNPSDSHKVSLQKILSADTNDNEKRSAWLSFKFNSERGDKFSSYFCATVNIPEGSRIDPNNIINDIYLNGFNPQIIENFKDQRMLAIKFLRENHFFGNNVNLATSFISLYENAFRRYASSKLFLNIQGEVTFHSGLKKELLSWGNTEEQINKLFNQFSKDYCVDFLTDSTGEEKDAVIALFSSGILMVQQLKDIYPLFYYFVNRSGEENITLPDSQKEIIDYFEEYTFSRIDNKPTEKLVQYVNGRFSTENFLGWYYSNEVPQVSKLSEEPSRIIVLDGVSGEYLWLLVSLLSKKMKRSPDTSEFRLAKIPTITSVNKERLHGMFPSINDDNDWILDYDDKVIHGTVYSPYKNVEKGLQVIDEITTRITNEVKDSSCLILADHGSTVLPHLIQVPKANNFEESEHEGRCAKINGKRIESNSSKGYIKINDGKNDWLIAVGPNSLQNRPRYECHGGATVEETVIPYIFFTSSSHIIYHINLINKSVTGLSRTISFAINPMPNLGQVKVLDELGNLLKVNLSDKLFSVDLISGKSQKISIIVAGQRHEYEITSGSGIDDGEDMFDL